VSAEPDHLPQRLWWLLPDSRSRGDSTGQAMKVALATSPWTFRTLCLGLARRCCSCVARRRPAPGSTEGSGERLAALAFFNITCWNVLVAFGLTMIARYGRRFSHTPCRRSRFPCPFGCRRAPDDAKLLGLAFGMAGLALLLGKGSSAWEKPRPLLPAGAAASLLGVICRSATR